MERICALNTFLYKYYSYIIGSEATVRESRCVEIRGQKKMRKRVWNSSSQYFFFLFLCNCGVWNLAFFSLLTYSKTYDNLWQLSTNDKVQRSRRFCYSSPHWTRCLFFWTDQRYRQSVEDLSHSRGQSRSRTQTSILKPTLSLMHGAK